MVSESAFPEHHNSDLKHPTHAAQRAAQVLSTAGMCGVSYTPNLTAGHCELWPLVFKKKETISWIAASYHCHSCLRLQEQEEMQKESALYPSGPEYTHRSCYRNSNLPRHIIFQQRFTSLLTESVYYHTRLLLLCVSLLKVGQPGDSTPPVWYRREAELALNHTELLV